MLERLAFEMEFNKTEKWLISGNSDQSEVLEMRNALLLNINRKIQQLDDESKKILNQYNDLHNELLPLVDDIEQVGIDFDIDKLRRTGELLIDRSKNESNRYRIEKSLKSLANSLEGNKLKTKLNLIGGVTHRITTASYNIQGLPNEIKACIIPSQFKRVYMIDFSAFEPSVAAYMSDDKTLIAYLKSDDGLYERLLKDLNLSSDYRNAVKVCFIGSFLFGGNYHNFKLSEEVPEVEWHNLIKKFSNYMLLRVLLQSKKI
ncbi:DNA polymerase [Mammaliicoccus sciuri]|uniref:DNA polymerase n=1 Tax=Mammaliicoccus sciuri TaxID=1296 RepID=UPI0020BD5F02|nr:DNA polymerase [Mammaliicoccus sciuri]